jgi:hypothetical protein
LQTDGLAYAVPEYSAGSRPVQRPPPVLCPRTTANRTCHRKCGVPTPSVSVHCHVQFGRSRHSCFMHCPDWYEVRSSEYVRSTVSVERGVGGGASTHSGLARPLASVEKVSRPPHLDPSTKPSSTDKDKKTRETDPSMCLLCCTQTDTTRPTGLLACCRAPAFHQPKSLPSARTTEQS